MWLPAVRQTCQQRHQDQSVPLLHAPTLQGNSNPFTIRVERLQLLHNNTEQLQCRCRNLQNCNTKEENNYISHVSLCSLSVDGQREVEETQSVLSSGPVLRVRTMSTAAVAARGAQELVKQRKKGDNMATNSH